MSEELYCALLGQLRTVACARSIDHLLDWDQQVMMPPQAAAGRSEQSSFIAGVYHRLLSSESLQDNIKQLKRSDGLSEEQRAVVDEASWRVSRAVNVPSELEERIAKLKVDTVQAWEAARDAQSFSGVSGLLAQLLECFQQRAEFIDSANSPYQVMVEDYERGAQVEDLRVMFAELKLDLTALVDELRALGSDQPVNEFNKCDFPKELQTQLCRKCIESIGFTFEAGRLDTATHPFCGTCGPSDIRLTTRYHENDLIFALTSSMHEAGHGLYEQGLAKEHVGNALGRYCSLGIHESQSIMWERHVGLSKEFWSYLYPDAQSRFPALADIGQSEYYKLMHRVSPGLIRIAADEITYHLHIIARFELESALVAGELPVGDLPAAWDDAYRDILGIVAKEPRDGVLQDIHWYSGHFGYFPTYTLGAMYSAQLFDAFAKVSPNWREDFSTGNYKHLLSWLGENIYQHGARYLPKDLIEKATGEPPSPKYLVTYLRNKYLDIFR